MLRSLCLCLGLLLLAITLGASAADKTETTKAGGGAVEGMIKDYNDKTMVLRIATVEASKKTAAQMTEVKLTDKTKIQYVEIADKDLQQLMIGYHVKVTLAPDSADTAASIQVSESVIKKMKK